MRVVDTHSHIYLDQFNDDRGAVVERAIEAGVSKILLPNIDVKTIKSMLSVQSNFPEVCHAMMGLHPTSVEEGYETQLKEMYGWLKKDKFCAVGEVGIDLYWDKTYKKQQVDAFQTQLDWAKEFNLPVVIHAREAFDEIFEVMDGMEVSGLTGVFHSFGGDVKQGEKILSDYPGFYLGINGVVTYKNSGLDKVVAALGMDKLVLETDAPYLTPAPYRGMRNEPSYLKFVVEKLSHIFKVSEDRVVELTTVNAKKIFKI